MHNINEADFRAAGFETVWHNDAKHFQARRADVTLNGWPQNIDADGRHKWMAFARVFTASPSEVLRAAQAGRFKMPPEFNKATCRSCGADIWWGETNRGKRIPLDADGEAHFATCSNADEHRQSR